MADLHLQTWEWPLLLLAVLAIAASLALILGLPLARRWKRTERLPTYQDEEMIIRPSQQVTGQILSLARDESGGPLVVEIGRARYRSFADVGDSKTKRQIVETARELIEFTGVLEQEPLDLAPAAKTETWREDLRRKSQAELERARSVADDPGTKPSPAAAAEDQFLNLLSEMGQAPPQEAKRKGLVSFADRRTPTLEGAVPQRSFVAEIEEIVQRRVLLEPALVGRDLHVRSGSEGEVLFVLDGAEYQSVDELPNLTARELILGAVTEWDATA